jgi:Catalytic LigB subunit of aromatic ring-opening dioxygenase
MLSVRPEFWTDRVPFDKSHPAHPYRGKTYTFDQMADLRKAERLGEQAELEVRKERHARCQHALQELGNVFDAAKSDVGVIIGNDQMEVFTKEHVPAFAIFWGPYVEGQPRTPEFLAKLPPGIARAELDRTPAEYTEWPCSPELGRHLIEQSTAAGFDVAQLTKLPTGEVGSNAAPHAYGFVYRRIMRDKVAPHVPVFVNTFYPPNQPTAVRCFELGRALGRAIASWPSDKSVYVLASGGLSHFVVDEEFDRSVIDALCRGDGETLGKIPESLFQSGTSEIKNWITVAGVMSTTDLQMKMIDYVPCYRSEAGTGSGMGFAYWR